MTKNISITTKILIFFVLTFVLNSHADNLHCKSTVIKPIDDTVYRTIDSLIFEVNYNCAFDNEFFHNGGWTKSENAHDRFISTLKKLNIYEMRENIINSDTTICLYDFPIYCKVGDSIIVVESDTGTIDDHEVESAEQAKYSFLLNNHIYFCETLPSEAFYITNEKRKVKLRDYNEIKLDWIFDVRIFIWTFLVRDNLIEEAYLEYVCGDSGCYPVYDLINRTNVVTHIWCNRCDR